jgi:glutathione peroxidase
MLIFLLACNQSKENKTEAEPNQKQTNTQQKTASIHQFTVKDIYGDNFSLGELKGNKVMIVNTASKCGLTPQYEGLQELYDSYKDQNFIILGFPANNFKSQEPGTNEEIIGFCRTNFGVSFPMMSKISVKGGDIHPLYNFLTKKEENKVIDSEVKWNFQKYLIDENGILVKVIDPKIPPQDEAIISWITQG